MLWKIDAVESVIGLIAVAMLQVLSFQSSGQLRKLHCMARSQLSPTFGRMEYFL